MERFTKAPPTATMRLNGSHTLEPNPAHAASAAPPPWPRRAAEEPQQVAVDFDWQSWTRRWSRLTSACFTQPT